VKNAQKGDETDLSPSCALGRVGVRCGVEVGAFSQFSGCVVRCDVAVLREGKGKVAEKAQSRRQQDTKGASSGQVRKGGPPRKKKQNHLGPLSSF